MSEREREWEGKLVFNAKQATEAISTDPINRCHIQSVCKTERERNERICNCEKTRVYERERMRMYS